MRFTNLADESAQYTAARAELQRAEIAETDAREQVAALRRRLPPGPALPDYSFAEVPIGPGAGSAPVDCRLAELFSAPGRSLIVYHLMYGKQQTSPCPMCTMWVDGFDMVARHVTRNADLAVVAAAGVDELSALAAERGWRHLRLLSAADSTFKYDLASEDAQGNQDSRVSVFTRDEDGTVRHFYTGAPHLSDERNERGIDLLCATWNLLDLTPGGRGEWYASLDY